MQPITQSMVGSATQLTFKAGLQANNALLRLSQNKTKPLPKRPMPTQSFSTRKINQYNNFVAYKPFSFRDEDDAPTFPALSSSPAFSNPFLSFDSATKPEPQNNSDSFMDMSEVAGQLPSAPSFGIFDSQDAVITMQDDAKMSSRKPNQESKAPQSSNSNSAPMDTLDALDEFEDGLNEDYEDAATKVARLLVQAHEQGMETDALGTQLAVSQLTHLR